MRILLYITILFFLNIALCSAQVSQLAFNEAANFYIQGKMDKAIERVEDGLRKDPANPRLRGLYEKLKKEDQERKAQEKKQQEKQEQEKQQKQEQQQNQ